jgi:hypothetical protein
VSGYSEEKLIGTINLLLDNISGKTVAEPFQPVPESEATVFLGFSALAAACELSKGEFWMRGVAANSGTRHRVRVNF